MTVRGQENGERGTMTVKQTADMPADTYRYTSPFCWMTDDGERTREWGTGDYDIEANSRYAG